jgi:hypothetical protein
VVVEEEEKAAVMSSRSIKTKPAVIIMDRKTKVMTTLCTLMSHLIHARRNATTTQANATDMITKLLITNVRSGLSPSMSTSWNTETVWIVTSRKDTMTTKGTITTTTMIALLGVSCGRWVRRLDENTMQDALV